MEEHEIKRRLQHEYQRGYRAARRSHAARHSKATAEADHDAVTDFVRRVSEMPDSHELAWTNIRDYAKVLLALIAPKGGEG